MMWRGSGFQRKKSAGCFLAAECGGASAGAVVELGDGVAGEPAVVGEGGDGVVDDAVGADVGVAVFDERLDHVDEGADEARGAGHERVFDFVRRGRHRTPATIADLKGAGVGEEGIDEELGDLVRVVGVFHERPCPVFLVSLIRFAGDLPSCLRPGRRRGCRRPCGPRRSCS